MKYSVLLLYPDYMSDAYGQETYYAHVEAGTPRQAAEKARLQAIKDVNEDEPCIDLNQAQDFFCLSVIEGYHQIKYDDFNQYPEDPPPPVTRRIVATVKLAYQDTNTLDDATGGEPGSILAEILTYNPATLRATSEIVAITGNTKRHIRAGYDLTRIDPCTFLDCLGFENKNGRLLDVKGYLSA